MRGKEFHTNAYHSKAVDAAAVEPSRATTAVPKTAAKIAPVQAATATSPTASGPPTTTCARPFKIAQSNQTTVDVNIVKKKLFPAPSNRQMTSSTPGQDKKCYQMKEDDLWSKLFHCNYCSCFTPLSYKTLLGKGVFGA